MLVIELSISITNFLEKSRYFVHQSSLAEQYGILGLITCEIIIGVYAKGIRLAQVPVPFVYDGWLHTLPYSFDICQHWAAWNGVSWKILRKIPATTSSENEQMTYEFMENGACDLFRYLSHNK